MSLPSDWTDYKAIFFDDQEPNFYDCPTLCPCVYTLFSKQGEPNETNHFLDFHLRFGHIFWQMREHGDIRKDAGISNNTLKDLIHVYSNGNTNLPQLWFWDWDLTTTLWRGLPSIDDMNQFFSNHLGMAFVQYLFGGQKRLQLVKRCWNTFQSQGGQLYIVTAQGDASHINVVLKYLNEKLNFVSGVTVIGSAERGGISKCEYITSVMGNHCQSCLVHKQ